jgi:hypothetical protein
LLLFFRSLIHLASLCSLFFFFGHVPPCSAWPVLRGGLAALYLVSLSRSSQFGRAALFCVTWVSADASVNSRSFQRESCIPVPTSTASPLRGIEERFVSQSSTWLLVGKAGWLASGMRGRLSAISASFDRPSTVLPIVALPRNRRTGHMRGVQDFSKNYYGYKLAAPRKAFFWPAFVARILTPRSRKFGHRLLLGCRSGLDAGPFVNFFCDDVRKMNWPNTEIIFTVCFGPASQSIRRGRISREGALDVR